MAILTLTVGCVMGPAELVEGDEAFDNDPLEATVEGVQQAQMSPTSEEAPDGAQTDGRPVEGDEAPSAAVASNEAGAPAPCNTGPLGSENVCQGNPSETVGHGSPQPLEPSGPLEDETTTDESSSADEE